MASPPSPCGSRPIRVTIPCAGERAATPIATGTCCTKVDMGGLHPHTPSPAEPTQGRHAGPRLSPGQGVAWNTVIGAPPAWPRGGTERPCCDPHSDPCARTARPAQRNPCMRALPGRQPEQCFSGPDAKLRPAHECAAPDGTPQTALVRARACSRNPRLERHMRKSASLQHPITASAVEPNLLPIAIAFREANHALQQLVYRAAQLGRCLAKLSNDFGLVDVVNAGLCSPVRSLARSSVSMLRRTTLALFRTGNELISCHIASRRIN